MPFFNFRRAPSKSAPNAAPATSTDSVEVIRRRARHRLIGAAVLVLIGVIGFPLVFDTQPRPVAIDIPIEIPGKNNVKPLTLPAREAASSAAAAAALVPVPASAPAEKVAAGSSLSPQEEIVSDRKPAVAPAASQPASSSPSIPAPASTASKPETRPLPKSEPKPTPKPAAAVDDGTRAKALLDGKPPAADAEAAATPAASEGRFIVQVGAFADVAKAREARLKVERAGLKTYTQVAETKDGKRIRVRVGPFATRTESEKAASKIRTLDLPAAILTL